MYYNDNETSMQQGLYNGHASVMAYDTVNNMEAQPQQIQVVHIDVNQLVVTIFQEIKAMLEYRQNYSKQVQAPVQEGQIVLQQQSDVGRLQPHEAKYIAVYAYNGFGVFTDQEKLKLRTQYWNGQYQWQAFNDYQSAMTYVRSGIAKIRNVSIECIPDNQRLNWMCYMQ